VACSRWYASSSVPLAVDPIVILPDGPSPGAARPLPWLSAVGHTYLESMPTVSGPSASRVAAGVSVPSGPYRSLSRLPAEVWLDAAGLARRISVCSEPTAATDAQVWSIVELWDFGVAVDITPPGPDEILAPSEAYRVAGEEPPGRNA
jgi:hypothetical protein